MIPPPGFAADVVVWQRRHGRHDLPWQRTRDPYRVWLSEVMLQQTQVATVIGYYTRFLERFPDVAALAAAPLDDVLALWSGLGYYSRARMMHRCAQQVMEVHGGHFPDSSAALATLPGIGRSTAAAVAAFCFGERAAILDGNVKRVLTRVLAFGDDLATAAGERRLWQLAESMLPDSDVDGYTQGLMDLGATVCLARRPACMRCPVQASCRAAAAGEPERYPVKTRRVRRGRREHVLGWLEHAGRIWLVKRPDSGVWASMWSLPEFSADAAWPAPWAGWPGATQTLPAIDHALTHFDWHLRPARHVLPHDAAAPLLQAVQDALAAEPSTAGGRWFTREEALAAGLPAPVRKLLA